MPPGSCDDSWTGESWAALLLESARLRVGKRKAAASEDYAEASRLKRREVEVSGRLETEARKASPCGDELLRLQEEKRRAVADEDYAKASILKKQIQALEEQSGCGGGPVDKFQAQAWKEALVLARQLGSAEDGPELLRELEASAPQGAFVATTSAVKEESVESSAPSAAPAAAPVEGKAYVVPDMTPEQLLAASNQDLWQQAWKVTWHRADAMGTADDEKQVYNDAQTAWKSWLAERDRLQRQRCAEDGRRKAEEILAATRQEKASKASAPAAKPAAAPAPTPDTTKSSTAASRQEPRGPAKAKSAPGASVRPGLSEAHLQAQEERFARDKGAQADWRRLSAEADGRHRAKAEAPRGGRDLCALVKQRCPADHPIQFERLLAVCPKGTTVKQLIQAMAKEPQEFRQNWDGSEYCVRPVNSRCVDWLPVQVGTKPPGFKDDAALPEEMLVVAKSIFEERLRPQGQTAEDPLAQFLLAPGRLPADTPLPFQEVLLTCPPGTTSTELIQMMSRRRESFRQDSTGKLFCLKPRVKCRTWGAVNPYLDPTAPATTPAPAPASARASAVVAASDMDGDY